MEQEQEDMGVPASPSLASPSGLSPASGSSRSGIANAERPFAKEFIRAALIAEIGQMLDELGNPPLVSMMYPKGWQTAPNDSLATLYDQCVRTFAKREKADD